MATDNKATIVLSAEDRTRAAFASAQRSLEGLQASTAGLAARFGAIGVAIAAAFQGISLKGVLDVADQLGKLSQKSGVAVETLSALRYAGSLADVSLEDLGDSLKKLNLNIAAAARGEKEQAAAFKAIGVAVTDAAGRVRSADAVLADIADRYAGYADGANKVAIGNAIGGKSFERLIPLLNGGSEGLKTARAELEKFGGVISADFAQRSEKFNDNLTKIAAAGEALKISLGGPLLDGLIKLSDKFLEARKSGTLLQDVLVGLATFSPAGILLGKIFADVPVDKIEEDAKRIRKAIAGLEADLARDPGNTRAQENLQRFRADLAALEAQARATQKATQASKRPANDRGGRFILPDAPALPATGAADDALAALRKQIEGRIKLIQDGVANERDILQFREQIVGIQYQQANVSLAAYYDRQDALRQQALQATRRGIADEIAEREKLLGNKGLKQSEREDIRNQIADAKSRLQKAEREADQEAERSALERNRVVEQLRDNLKSLDAEIAAAAGDESAQALVEIATKVRDAERLLSQAGESPAEAARRAQQLGTLLDQRRQFGELQTQIGRANAEAARAEELLLIAQRERGTGLIESEDQIYAARARSLDQLQALIERTRQLANVNPNNVELQQFLADLQLQAARAREVLDPRKLRLDQASAEIGDALAEGVGRAIKNVRDLRGILLDTASSIFDIINRELVVKPLATYFTDLVKGAGGSGGLLGALGIGGLGQGAATAAAQSAVPDAASTALQGLTAAATGSTDVLGKLPSLAAIPATTAITGMGLAAQIAAQALGQLAAAAALGQAGAIAGSSGFGSLGLGGLIGGGGGFGTGANFGNLDLGLFLHKGGIAGQDGSPTRYHSGGVAGLMPDEVPAILRRGEEVLTRRDPRHRDNAGRRVQFSPVFQITGPVDRRTAEQIEAAAARGMQTALRRGTAGVRR